MPVELTPRAAKELTELPRVIRSRVMQLIERLDHWPRISGAKPLRGTLSGRYRLRTGDYRVQFHLRGAAAIIERIGHRDGFYEG